MTYYSQRLAGERLRQVYEIAPPRVQQYLQSEIDFVASYLSGSQCILELGCGYGRAMFQLAARAAQLIGVDTARESLMLGKKLGENYPHCVFLEMDATQLGFADCSFDLVYCIQNGICAFRVDQELLIRETLRVLRPGGKALFATYSPEFWPERLAWFELQSQYGLVGPIDYARTTDGTVVCTDGFKSGTLTREGFESLCSKIGVSPAIHEIDNSSLFCEITKPK